MSLLQTQGPNTNMTIAKIKKINHPRVCYILRYDDVSVYMCWYDDVHDDVSICVVVVMVVVCVLYLSPAWISTPPFGWWFRFSVMFSRWSTLDWSSGWWSIMECVMNARSPTILSINSCALYFRHHVTPLRWSRGVSRDVSGLVNKAHSTSPTKFSL